MALSAKDSSSSMVVFNRRITYAVAQNGYCNITVLRYGRDFVMRACVMVYDT